MDQWGDYSVWREHRRELLREAQERQLEREASKARESFARPKGRPGSVEVRWGLSKDETKIAELLELNGVPRWVAFEERFIVAELGDELMAAVRYRTETKRLLLGPLVVDPWPGWNSFGERRLAVALYAGARELALELGAREIVAKTDSKGAGYPYEAGYCRWGEGWRLDTARPVRPREELPLRRWRRWSRLTGTLVAALLPPRNAPASLGEAAGHRACESAGARKNPPLSTQNLGKTTSETQSEEGQMDELSRTGRSALEDQPFSTLIGARLVNLLEGEAVLEVPIRNELLQQNGFVHGGVVSFAADNALAFAGCSMLGPAVLTSEYKINYLRPAGGQRLVARASVVYAGKRQAVCRCDVFSVQGDLERILCAVAQGTISATAVDGRERESHRGLPGPGVDR